MGNTVEIRLATLEEIRFSRYSHLFRPPKEVLFQWYFDRISTVFQFDILNTDTQPLETIALLYH